MAQIQLIARVESSYPHTPAYDRSNQAIHIPGHRLYVSLSSIRRDSDARHWHPRNLDYTRAFEAVVDTGCSLTVLPYTIWQAIVQDITWLNHRNAIAVAGHVFGYQLGRLRLAAFDSESRFLAPATTIVQCLDDSSDPPPALLGLSSKLLARRQLRHAGYGSRELPIWWLEDA